MRKILTEEKRKTQIIEAAINVISEYGLCNFRIADVAKQALASHGLVFHHFGSKENLILEMMRSVVETYETESVKIVTGKKTPSDRINKLVRLALEPKHSSGKSASVWIALYYLASFDSQAHALLLTYQTRNFHNVHSVMSELFEEPHSTDRTKMVVTIIDGIWLQHAVKSSKIELTAARKMVKQITDIALR